MDRNPYAEIQSRYDALSGVMKKIADYVMEDVDRIQDISIQQLAQQLSIAESSVIRFCKLLGFSGFAEFKMKMAKYGAAYASSIYENLEWPDSAEAVTRQVFQMNCSALQMAAELLDFGRIEAAAALIRDTRKIVVCGVGLAASVADNCAAHMLRIGLPAVSVTDSKLMQFSANLSEPGTLFLAVSKTGNEIALVNAFRLARERGAATVCLTCYVGTPLEACCDVCILHYYPPETLRTTRIVQHTVIDCLITAATIDRKEEVIGALAANLSAEKVLHLSAAEKALAF